MLKATALPTVPQPLISFFNLLAWVRKKYFWKFQQEEEVKHSDEPKTKKEQVYEVFKELIMLVETPEMRKRTLNIFFSWLIVAMVYYGLSFNSKNIGGNRYVASFASGFVEVHVVDEFFA